MTLPDYITLLLYVIGIFAISTVASRRNSSHEEMFSAGRRSPWWASGLSGFMTIFSAGTFVVWGGVAYELGVVAISINLCYGIAALLVGYFVAGRWNKLGVATPAEFVQLRFGTTGLHFFTWAMLIKRILGVSVSLYALAVMLTVLVPMNVPTAIIIFGVIVVLYTMQGGLWAVLMTDVLQFIVLTIVVLLVAVMMLMGYGSSQAPAELPASFYSPIAGKYGLFFLMGWVTIHFFMIGAEWAFVQRFLSVRNQRDARWACYLFGFMYLVTPLLWLAPPLLYRTQVSGADKEQAYILAAQSVLPAGMMGLMFAAMFSATASMVSSQLNVFAGVLTNDFYKSLFQPNASERTLVRVGRIFTAVLGALLVTTAILVPFMGGAEKLIISINSLLVVPLFAPTLWGLLSKKIGLRDMIVVALTSFALGLIARFGLANNPWIVETSSLWNVSQLLRDNAKNAEVVIGVAFPVVMLLCIQFFKKGDVDHGWTMVQRQAENAEISDPSTDAEYSFDPFPAQMVMVSLLLIGAWLICLSFVDSAGRNVVICTAIGLMLVAAVIRRSIKNQNNKLDSQ